MKFLKSILFSWDTAGAVLISGVILLLIPDDRMTHGFAKDVYLVAISVLSIVFSVFFAALAIIMSSSDDAFLHYLEERGHYKTLMHAFEWTLWALFLALIYSIVLYVYASAEFDVKIITHHPKVLFVIFGFMFAYSMLATFLSCKTSLKYAQYRATFVRNKDKFVNGKD